MLLLSSAYLFIYSFIYLVIIILCCYTKDPLSKGITSIVRKNKNLMNTTKGTKVRTNGEAGLPGNQVSFTQPPRCILR